MLQQSLEDFELIVSDDSSTDDTARIVRLHSDQRLSYRLNPKKMGQFANFNACIRAARGRYLQFFSHDDVMEPDALETQLAYLRQYPDAGLVYCGVVYIGEDGKILGDSSADRTPEYLDRDLYLRIAMQFGALPASISTVMVPRAVLQDVGRFDPEFRVAGDCDLWNRIADQYPVAHTPAQLIRVRSHGGQVTHGELAGLHYMQEEIKIARWFRDTVGDREWNSLMDARLRLRGDAHCSWALRQLLCGRPRRFWAALKFLSDLYPLWPLWSRFVLRRLRRSGNFLRTAGGPV